MYCTVLSIYYFLLHYISIKDPELKVKVGSKFGLFKNLTVHTPEQQVAPMY